MAYEVTVTDGWSFTCGDCGLEWLKEKGSCGHQINRDNEHLVVSLPEMEEGKGRVIWLTK